MARGATFVAAAALCLLADSALHAQAPEPLDFRAAVEAYSRSRCAAAPPLPSVRAQSDEELGLGEQRFAEDVHKAPVEVARLTRTRDRAHKQIGQRGRIDAFLACAGDRP